MRFRQLPRRPRRLHHMRPGMSVKDAVVLSALRAGRTVRVRARRGVGAEELLVSPQHPAVGDIAVCWRERTWVADLVRAEEPGRLLLQGESAAGEWVSKAAVVGRAVSMPPNVRGWLRRMTRGWKR